MIKPSGSLNRLTVDQPSDCRTDKYQHISCGKVVVVAFRGEISLHSQTTSKKIFFYAVALLFGVLFSDSKSKMLIENNLVKQKIWEEKIEISLNSNILI